MRRSGTPSRGGARLALVSATLFAAAMAMFPAPGAGASGSGALQPSPRYPSGLPSQCGMPQSEIPPVGRGMPAGPVRAAQRWLVDSEGRVLLFHGLNEVNGEAPCSLGFSGLDAQWMSANGFEMVRLGIHPSVEMPTPGHIDSEFVGEIVATVDELARHHVFTFIDWHQDDYGTYFDSDGMPDWMTLTHGATNVASTYPLAYLENPALSAAFQSFWDDDVIPGGEGLQEYYVAMVTAVVSQLAHDPWVIGYEIMNEPWPGTGWSECMGAGGCPSLEQSELLPFYTKVARAIRAAGSNQVILFEPFITVGEGLGVSNLSPPTGVSNVAFAFHQYALTPAGEPAIFAGAEGWAEHHSGAIVNTEWSDWLDTSISRQAGEEDTALVPWTFWQFANCDTACTPGSASAEDSVVYDMAQPPAGSNLNEAVSGAIVRPYPIAVAGTPTGVSFDTGTRTLSVSWTPARVARRGSFASGSLTAISTPQAVYPTGYRVSVRGGAAVSSPCAADLVVAQRGAPGSISVTVAPAASCR